MGEERDLKSPVAGLGARAGEKRQWRDTRVTESDLSAGFAEDSVHSRPLSPILPDECFRHAAGSSAELPQAKPSQRGPLSTDPELPAAGTILGKYRLEETIGNGAFAAVYRATHLLLHMPVAIKLLRPAAMRRVAGLAQMLYEEARYAARINHPNVVRIFDVTHTPAITYVVMELIEGSTLSRTLSAHGALSTRRLVRLGCDVVAGLQAALEQGLIHRDIKPSNILLARDGHASIVDLGLALPLDRAESVTKAVKLSTVGTPAYMAPEQGLDPASVDFRADIYALGATLYHAAVGSPPFPLDDPDRCIWLHRNVMPRAPHDLRPSIPEDLSCLLMKMLAKSPADRPASYSAIFKALEQAVARLPAG